MENIKTHIDTTLKLYENSRFSEFINNLLLLKNEASKFDPEKMALDFVDFLMDDGLWSWVVSCFDKKPNDFDWQAASYVASDLKDILVNNKILA